MNYKSLISACMALLLGAMAQSTPPSPCPNILFILADDLGYMDINAYAARVTGVPARQQYYETPHLDRLAQSGTAFAQAYACQLCSPTRAGLLTGRNAAKIGVTTATPGSVKTLQPSTCRH